MPTASRRFPISSNTCASTSNAALSAPAIAGVVARYLADWGLEPDGDTIVTRGARLLPVLRDGRRAMLKICLDDAERRANALMTWWNGDGAAPVLAVDGAAILMVRACEAASPDGTSLARMARSGRDEAACRILCATAARLHAARPRPWPELMQLERWFDDLGPAANRHGGILVACAEAARSLLAEPREIGVLHGDLHHGNVLAFGEDDWRAIDPKGLVGERCFDFAALFMNPDLADAARPVASRQGCLARRVETVAEAARLEPRRLLRWVLAGAGLSAAWFLNDGEPADISLGIAATAAAELER